MRKFLKALLIPVLLTATLACDLDSSSTSNKPGAGKPTANNPLSNTVRNRIVRSNYAKGEVQSLCNAKIEVARQALEQLVKDTSVSLELRQNFDASLLKFENIFADFSDATSPLSFMGYVSQDPAIREEGGDCEQNVGAFYVEMAARKDLYNAIKDALPRNDQEIRLKQQTLLSFVKNGLNLPDDQLAEVTKLRTKLSQMESEFSTNLNEDVSSLTFTKAELEGLSDAQLQKFKLDSDGKYIVTTKEADYALVASNAKNPQTRKALMTAYWNRAAASNTQLLNDAVALREQIAHKLGYKTWADYRIQGRMAETSENVYALLNSLKSKLSERNKQDINVLLQAKRQMEDPNATQIQPWDLSYFSNQVKKTQYSVDAEQISEYFPKDVVVDGMFQVYSTLLHVNFEEVKDADVWSPDVKMYSIRNQSDNQIVGYFYTDLFPRAGKYGHAAAFPQISGRKLAEGYYSQPVAAIVANLSPPTADRPSLLTHDDVETLFHEFGHIMHMTLTQAPYASLSGSNVAQDFVEAPSQMLENWVWDKQILSIISGHYTDHSIKLPDDILNKMLAAKDFNQGYFYTRQLVLGLTDMDIHSQPGQIDVDKVYDQKYEELLGIPSIPGTHFMATFGHMMGGYDAGYYGYIWSEVYAADMFTRFEANLLDPAVGLSYRQNILERGSMLPELQIVTDFLGRAPTTDAFYRKLGID